MRDDRMVVFYGLVAGLGICHVFFCMFATMPTPDVVSPSAQGAAALVTGLIGGMGFGIASWFNRTSKEDFRACVFLALSFALTGSGAFFYRFFLAA